jgi:hypothetical protein
MMQVVFETVIFRMDDAYMQSEQDKARVRQATAEREAMRNKGKTKTR